MKHFTRRKEKAAIATGQHVEDDIRIALTSFVFAMTDEKRKNTGGSFSNRSPYPMSKRHSKPSIRHPVQLRRHLQRARKPVAFPAVPI
jgi:hypothetical protein